MTWAVNGFTPVLAVGLSILAILAFMAILAIPAESQPIQSGATGGGAAL